MVQHDVSNRPCWEGGAGRWWEGEDDWHLLTNKIGLLLSRPLSEGGREGGREGGSESLFMYSTRQKKFPLRCSSMVGACTVLLW